jgi:hypothetical protein
VKKEIKPTLWGAKIFKKASEKVGAAEGHVVTWSEGLAVSAPRRVEVDEEVLVRLDGFVIVLGVQNEDTLFFGNVLKGGWKFIFKVCDEKLTSRSKKELS